MNKRLAIIGGRGYVGNELLKFWSWAGHKVTATTTSESQVEELTPYTEEVMVMRLNIPSEVESLVSCNDIIVVCAGAKDRYSHKSTYLEGNYNLAQALSKTTGKQIIYLSSTSVYADSDGEWIDEDSNIDVGNEKSRILFEAEEEIRKGILFGHKVCVYRLGGIYGRGRELEPRLGFMAGTKVTFDGTNYVNFIELRDIVGAINFAFVNELSGTYNLVNDCHLRTRDILEELIEDKGLPPVLWGNQKGGYTKNTRVSNAKLRKEGYAPSINHLFIENEQQR